MRKTAHCEHTQSECKHTQSELSLLRAAGSEEDDDDDDDGEGQTGVSDCCAAVVNIPSV